MCKAEQAVERAQTAYEIEPPDLSNLASSIELFRQAEALDQAQKVVLGRVVEDATKAYIVLMPRDQTYTEHAVFAYETLLGEGIFSYDEVGPDAQTELDRILTLSVLYLRRAEQLKAQARRLRAQRAAKAAETLEERKNVLYKLGALQAQLYFGKQLEGMQGFADVEAAISRLDQNTFPGFREVLVTDYVVEGLRTAYNLQRLGQSK